MGWLWGGMMGTPVIYFQKQMGAQAGQLSIDVDGLSVPLTQASPPPEANTDWLPYPGPPGYMSQVNSLLPTTCSFHNTSVNQRFLFNVWFFPHVFCLHEDGRRVVGRVLQ